MFISSRQTSNAFKHTQGAAVGDRFHKQDIRGRGEREVRYRQRNGERRERRSSASASDQQSSQELLLNRYQVMETRGADGFGTVLDCWDTRLQRRVAIKSIPLAPQDQMTSRQIIGEALDEARASSKIANPNIVTMYDFQSDEDYAYLVMEFIDGLTLSEFLARIEGGTLTGDECAHLVTSIGNALAFAHKNRVLHLDVKPSNILLERSGAIKLCDFGMATLASATGYGGARGGTVGYMPPEQINGRLVDERCDVFSLAVVCWQALTGENPFSAGTAEKSLEKIERGPRQDISKLSDDLTDEAAQAITQAISANPAARPPSVEAFAKTVSSGLGDPRAGAKSIKSLLAQSVDDSGGSSKAHIRKRLPLSYRYPWLLGALIRVASAAATTWAVYLTSAAYLGRGTQRQLVACAVAALATLALTPAGSILAIASLVAAVLGTSAGAGAVALCVISCVALGVWWLWVGKADKLSSCAIILPACTLNPLLGAPVAAFSESALKAAVTALISWVLAFMVATLAPLGPNVAPGLSSLPAKLLTFPTLISCASAPIAAACGALVTQRWRSVRSGIVGQFLCAVLLASAQLAALRVENGDVWSPSNWVYSLAALFLCVILCFMVVVRGPLPTDGEVEKFNESA